jgi:type II secretory pathway predicted ATPase ExeA
MYLQQFNLTEKPFEQSPDSRFLYASEQHAYALASIRFAVASRDPFFVVTGEIGSGKTTLLNCVLADLDQRIVVARINHTQLSAVDLLQMILVEFGMEPFAKGKAELLTTIRRFVQQQAAAQRQVLIVIDEAQNLSAALLEELRLLTCIETERQKLLSIVLLGQPQLSQLLNSPELEQLRQRCRLRIHIDELTADEVGGYLRHRMAVAGGDYDQAFAPGVDRLIHRHTGGVPRLINLLCDTALTACLVESQPRVTPGIVEDVVRELKWSGRESGGQRAARANAQDACAWLQIIHRGHWVADVALLEDRNVIGRDVDCQVVIDDKFFSRYHAAINREEGGWVLRDLNSTNGTSVRGKAVGTWRLTEGDVIEIGKHRLVFVAGRSREADVGVATQTLDAAVAND